MELPAKLEVIAEDEESVNQETVHEELKVLYTELFERLGIEHTSKLLDAFVELSLSHALKELNVNLTQEQPAPNAPKDKGTHEFITKLLARISNIKKVLLNAYQVGKSAMQLYTLDLAFVPID